MKKLSPAVKTVLKTFFVLLPIVWILLKVDFSQLYLKFQGVPAWSVIAFTVILFFRTGLQSYRFQYLTRLYTDSLKVGRLFFLDMKARYYSVVIPSSVGQDIVRGTMLKEHLSADQIVSVSLFFRITGVLPFFILSFFGIIPLSAQETFRPYIPGLILSSCLFFGGVIALFSHRVSKAVGSIVLPRLPQNVRLFIRNVVVAFQQYKTNPKLMAGNFLNSLLTQFLAILCAAVSIKGITGQWYFAETLAFIPIIELMAILVPFAPNGAGVREVMSILMFTMLGRSHEEMLVYIAINMIGHLINLSGIFAVIADKIYISKRKD